MTPRWARSLSSSSEGSRRPPRLFGVDSHSMVLSVPGMTCGHCEAAVTTEVSALDGVSAVAVDLDAKTVTVTGTSLDRERIVAAIDEAGFDVG